MINYELTQYSSEKSLITDVIKTMLKKNKTLEYCSAMVICKSDLAEKLIKILMSATVNGSRFDVNYIEFDKYDYKHEYAILIDTEGSLSIEKMYYDGESEPKTFSEDLVYIDGECNSKLFINQTNYNEDAVIPFYIIDEYYTFIEYKTIYFR